LVDDGSLEDVEEIRVFLKHMKTAFGIRVKFHRQHLGVGYASIMTQASRLAEGKYLMLLNNDVMMTKGAIRALYRIFEDYSDVGVAVPLFVQPNGQILDAGGIIFTDASAWQYGRGVPLNSDSSHPYE
jgi:GT2 family glycosyltransferase